MQRSLATGHAAGADTVGQPSGPSVHTESWVPEHEVSPSVHDDAAQRPAQSQRAPAHAFTSFAHGRSTARPGILLHPACTSGARPLALGEHAAAPSGLPSHASAHCGCGIGGDHGRVAGPAAVRTIRQEHQRVVGAGRGRRGASGKRHRSAPRSAGPPDPPPRCLCKAPYVR